MGSWKKKIENELRKKHVLTSDILSKGHLHKEVDFQPAVPCHICKGYGYLEHNGSESECYSCEGTGEEYVE